MSDYDAVLFDMDGVIVDSEEHWQSRLPTIFDHATDANVPIDDFIGCGPHEQYKRLSAEYEVNLSRTEYIELYDNYAESIYRDEVELMAEFDEIITSLKEAGTLIGLISSSPFEWIAMVIDEFDLVGIFDVILSGDSLDIPGKPHPVIYQQAADELGTVPSSCVAVEDTQTGVKAANSADMYCIAYCTNRDRTDKVNAADEIVISEEEIRSRLRSLFDLDQPPCE